MQQYADTLQSSLNYNTDDYGIPAMIGYAIEKHAIVSDAGVGESKSKWYEAQFKKPESRIYKEQMKWH